MLRFFSLMPGCVLVALFCQQAVADPLLDAHWTFDSDFTDSSGNNHDGTSVGGAGGASISNAAGDFIVGSGAVRLDRTNGQYVEMTGYNGITGSASRTVSTWLRADTPIPSQNQGIISWGSDDSGRKWTFRTQDTNGLDGATRIEVNGGYVVGNVAVTDGSWHHVAVVFQEDANPNVTDAVLYVDGLPVGVSSQSGEAIDGGGTNPSGTVRVGRRVANNTDNFDGVIDDTGIFASALSAAEIRAIPELALNSSLGYDLSDATELFIINDDQAGSIEINGRTWEYVPGLNTGQLGQVVEAFDEFDFALQLDSLGGVAVAAVVPEPASVAVWSLLGLGLVGFGYYRTKRKK